jgi:hypothetical protein
MEQKQRRHPLANELHALHLRKKQMSISELEQALEFAQRRVEFYWEAPPPFGFTEDMPPFPGPARCGREGCNYRRYPASRFCMYHVVGNDTFAEHLRRAKAALPQQGEREASEATFKAALCRRNT